MSSLNLYMNCWCCERSPGNRIFRPAFCYILLTKCTFLLLAKKLARRDIPRTPRDERGIFFTLRAWLVANQLRVQPTLLPNGPRRAKRNWKTNWWHHVKHDPRE